MCGIIGYVSTDGKHTIKPEQIKKMLVKCQSRGKDSTGIYSIGSRKKYGQVQKNNVQASEFVNQADWSVVEKAQVVLGHCRHATQGTPKLAQNNHPLIKNELILIHNGVVYNDHEFGIDRKTCDSYAILEAITRSRKKSMRGRVIDGLKDLSGSIACAIFDQEHKDLYLFRNNMPIVIGFNRNTISFASTGEILSPARPLTTFNVREDSLVHINLKSGLMRTTTINTRRTYSYGTQASYTYTYNGKV